MPRQPSFPKFPTKPHKSGQARIRIRNRDVYLGVFGSDESRQRYAQLAAEFAADPNKFTLPAPEVANELTIADIVSAWSEAHQEGDQETREIKRALKVLARVYGPTFARDFDADRLEHVRAAMVSGSWMNDEERAQRKKYKHPIGWCLSQTNHAIGRVKRVFRWAEKKKLVNRGCWEHLKSLPPLGRKDKVRRTKPRQAPPEGAVEKIIPELTPMIAAMLDVSMLTGMRPAEVCRMHAHEIETTGPEGCWLYRMGADDHKTGHFDGEESVVVLGPLAQAAIAPWLEMARRIGPRTAIWRPRPATSSHYTPAGFYRAIIRACDRARVERITPYQLRHYCRLRVTRELSLDHARAVLRHKSLTMSAQYAQGADIESAAKAMKLLG